LHTLPKKEDCDRGNRKGCWYRNGKKIKEGLTGSCISARGKRNSRGIRAKSRGQKSPNEGGAGTGRKVKPARVGKRTTNFTFFFKGGLEKQFP